MATPLTLDQITGDDLAEITRLAELFFVPKEIAMMLGYDVGQFRRACNQEGGEVYTAYMSGRLQRIAQLRTSILNLATQGSSPAQTAALQILQESEARAIER